MEEWIQVRGYPAYSISSMGRVRHDRIGRILEQKVDRNGFTRVRLFNGQSQDWLYVADLMGWHFIRRYNERTTLEHVDGDRTNCMLTNLRPRYDGDWKTVIDDPTYEMNEEGEIRRIGGKRVLVANSRGTVNLSSGGRAQTRSVAKMRRELFGR